MSPLRQFGSAAAHVYRVLKHALSPEYCAFPGILMRRRNFSSGASKKKRSNAVAVVRSLGATATISIGLPLYFARGVPTYYG